MRFPQRLLLSLLAWVALCGELSAELQIERVRWGFAGKPMCEAFNLLTVEVRNDSEKPFVGALSLEQGFGLGRIGAPLVQSCSIAPYGSRVVQFAPYLDQSSSDWRLTWRGGRYRLDDVLWDGNERKAVIEFTKPNKVANVGGTSGEFARFPEAEFPSNPSVTEALYGVVLDHVPTWEAPRKFGQSPSA